MSVFKDEVTSLLDWLPEDVSIEYVHYQLYVVERYGTV